MSAATDAYPIDLVTACLTASGAATFVLTTVAVTQGQAENGIHYYLAEADLLEGGYEGPFVHFDARESPPFLHAAVRKYLGIPAENPESNNLVPAEEA